MTSETIVLREEHSAGGSRYLQARITETGDLRIEGQDLGRDVEAVWGAGLREYEWVITVRATHLPQLIAVLGGMDGDNILSLLAAKCSEDDRYASKSFLEEKGIPIEFWNHVGE